MSRHLPVTQPHSIQTPLRADLHPAPAQVPSAHAAAHSARFTFAVPFYQGIDYLMQLLQSIRAQTDPNWLAIIVDDASTGAGADKAIAALSDDRIIYVRHDEHGGIATNLNRCLAAVEAFGREPQSGIDQAALAALVHADDVLQPQFVAHARAMFAAHPDAVAIAPRANVIDADGTRTRPFGDRVKALLWPRSPVHRLNGDRGTARLLRGFFLYFPAITYQPRLMADMKFDPRWNQVLDVDLLVRLLRSGATIVADRTTTYSYRRHEASATSANTRSLLRFDEESRLWQEIADEARLRHGTAARRLRHTAQLRCVVRLSTLAAALSPSQSSAHRRFAIRLAISR